MFPWYDGPWLDAYWRARAILARDRPGALDAFVQACNVFEVPRDFSVPTLDAVFDASTLAEIRRVLAALRPDELDYAEVKMFGRFVVRDQPYLMSLHRAITPLVSRLAAEPLEPSYVFGSLYGASGMCSPHLDGPDAKWTLDLCVDQSGPWPIHFSQVVPWPRPGEWPDDAKAFEGAVRSSDTLRFTPVTLRPGQAVLFSGPNQWHYRDRMPVTPGRQFCDLVFFHFVPQGAFALTRPENWARIFNLPELAGLALETR